MMPHYAARAIIASEPYRRHTLRYAALPPRCRMTMRHATLRAADIIIIIITIIFIFIFLNYCMNDV